MRCRTCGYTLEGLPERTCPECGTAFDPGDPTTYAADKTRSRRSLVLVAVFAAAPPWAFLALVHIALIGARLSLGRWPHRFGMDDPKGIAGIRFFLTLAVVAWCTAPIGLLVSCGLPLYVGFRGGWRQAARLLAYLAGAWGLAGALIYVDPANALVWFMD